ncbi:MAG: hypothetical protein ACC662_02245, partial [Planctomycetota bacterium]
MPKRFVPLFLAGVLVLLASIPGRAGEEAPALELESLGIPATRSQVEGHRINVLRFYDGRLYVGTGDATVNTGPTDVLVFDPARGRFSTETTVDDEAILRFRVLDGRLVVPGVDATESWEFGNVYVREEGDWTKHRTIPHAIHVLDVAAYTGRWYAATGHYVEPKKGEMIADGAIFSSGDRGATWRMEALTPATRTTVFRFGSLAVFREKLYAFPYAYVDVPAAQIPPRLRPFAGPGRREGGDMLHTLFVPDALGPVDVLVHDGEAWTPRDLVPDPGLCTATAFVFRDRLLLSTVSGRWVAPFGDAALRTRRQPPETSTALWAFDGKATRRLDVRYDVLRSVLVKDGRLALLVLRDGRWVILETTDLEGWRATPLAIGRGQALSIERDGTTWYVGSRDGNLFRSTGTTEAAGPTRFEILADLPRQGASYWAAIEEWADPGRAAALVVTRAAPDRVDVLSENVAGFTVFLEEGGLCGEVTLTIDGAEAFRANVTDAAELHATRVGDSPWEVVPGPRTAASFHYTPQVIG